MTDDTDAIGVRNDLTDFIDTYGSAITITPRTPSEGNYGGYEQRDPNEGTAVSTLAIPSSNVISKSTSPFGKLKEGEVLIDIKYDEVIAKDYLVTWQGDGYTVTDFTPIRMTEVIVAYRVLLSRRLDDG